MPEPDERELLRAAVAAVGGAERPGQVAMAEGVARAIGEAEHLLVQAGTGTGKSLAYLVPALASGERVVVATATIALQSQIVDRDLPVAVDAMAPLLGRRPTYAMLKGRANYLCLHRVNEGVPDDQGVLVDVTPTTELGREVQRLHGWAKRTKTGDRDEVTLGPTERGPSDRAWAQVSVSARECLGRSQCLYGDRCFAERARDRARDVDLVVTNHALLAIDVLGEAPVLPEHDVVIIDEAHELVARVTAVVTDELTPGLVERACRRVRPHVGGEVADRLADAARALGTALDVAPPGRLTASTPGGDLRDALVAVRDTAGQVVSAFSGERDRSALGEEAARRQARVLAEDVHTVAGRLVAMPDHDVAWVSEREQRYGPALRVAPLSVAGPLREHLFAGRTVVLTSATLKLGGDFTAIAGAVGLNPDPEDDPGAGPEGDPGAGPEDDPGAGPEDGMEDDDVPLRRRGLDPLRWCGLDVGSPFDYRRQSILYVARHLPAPGRDGIADRTLDELADLIVTAGGRTLGLFSSMRAATRATEALRERLDVPILCQGEDATAALVRRFASDVRTCLFGTISLWQGVDVPGSACQLVVVDRIPFPRPDNPLMAARQRAVDEAGGNGFMAVGAAHAALLLAQGCGRLVRSLEDRGVVAILDPRLAYARYAGFLRASLPAMWFTTDPVQVRRSLAAIDMSAPPPRPVARRSPHRSAQSR